MAATPLSPSFGTWHAGRTHSDAANAGYLANEFAAASVPLLRNRALLVLPRLVFSYTVWRLTLASVSYA